MDLYLVGKTYGLREVFDRFATKYASVLYSRTEAQQKQLFEDVRNVGEGWKIPPIPAEAFNVNANDREWVNRQ